MTTERPTRSERGRQRYQTRVLTPLEQIPVLPGSGSIAVTGAWAYYIRPEGATISEALILYPNGGIPDIDDARMRARYGEHAVYYRERQAAKGFEYVGQQLTEGAMARLVEVLAKNRGDELLFCEDEIADCDNVMNNSDRPEIRDQARRRKGQFAKRLEYLEQPIDPEELVAELNEIARAQQLAKVDPNVLRVMRSMIGEVNERMAGMVSHFQSGRTTGEGAPARFTKGDGKGASNPDA